MINDHLRSSRTNNITKKISPTNENELSIHGLVQIFAEDDFDSEETVNGNFFQTDFQKEFIIQHETKPISTKTVWKLFTLNGAENYILGVTLITIFSLVLNEILQYFIPLNSSDNSIKSKLTKNELNEIYHHLFSQYQCFIAVIALSFTIYNSNRWLYNVGLPLQKLGYTIDQAIIKPFSEKKILRKAPVMNEDKLQKMESEKKSSWKLFSRLPWHRCNFALMTTLEEYYYYHITKSVHKKEFDPSITTHSPTHFAGISTYDDTGYKSGFARTDRPRLDSENRGHRLTVNSAWSFQPDENYENYDVVESLPAGLLTHTADDLHNFLVRDNGTVSELQDLISIQLHLQNNALPCRDFTNQHNNIGLLCMDNERHCDEVSDLALDSELNQVQRLVKENFEQQELLNPTQWTDDQRITLENMAFEINKSQWTSYHIKALQDSSKITPIEDWTEQHYAALEILALKKLEEDWTSVDIHVLQSAANTLPIAERTPKHLSALLKPTQSISDLRDISNTSITSLLPESFNEGYIETYSFNPLQHTYNENQRISLWLLYGTRNISTQFNVVVETFQKKVPFIIWRTFVEKLSLKYYRKNPYHNFSHATDVTHCLYQYINKMSAYDYLDIVDIIALMIAALSHDVSHPGLSNPFLIETQHRLALQHNDNSPLENMHCTETFNILSHPDSALFQNFSRTEVLQMRRVIIDSILHTDMVHHFGMIKDMDRLFLNHGELLINGYDTDTRRYSEDVNVFLSKSERKGILMNIFLHAADISNTVKPFDVSSAWAYRALNEFFKQGDVEKQLGIPLQMLNDRNTVNIPQSQLGFIEFVVAPYYFSLFKVFPVLTSRGEALLKNISKWKQLWIDMCSPDQSEIECVSRRMAILSDKFIEAVAHYE